MALTGFRTSETELHLLKLLMRRRGIRKKSDYFRGLLLIDAERAGLSIAGIDIPNWAFPILRGLVEDRAQTLRGRETNRVKAAPHGRRAAAGF